jgi:four helix bundle protein
MAHYDLEERTLRFARETRQFIKRIPIEICNQSDCKQVIRSSGSIGANYIEANESLSKKDFAFRVKIARKEAKETRYWLACLEENIPVELNAKRLELHNEATELMKILSAILKKTESS